MEASQKGSHVIFVRRSGEVVDTAIVPKCPRFPWARYEAFSVKLTSTQKIGNCSDEERLDALESVVYVAPPHALARNRGRGRLYHINRDSRIAALRLFR